MARRPMTEAEIKAFEAVFGSLDQIGRDMERFFDVVGQSPTKRTYTIETPTNVGLWQRIKLAARMIFSGVSK